MDGAAARTDAARAWIAGRCAGTPFDESPMPADLNEAYCIQDALVSTMADKHIGWKIALTNPAARMACNSKEPISGRLLHGTGWSLDACLPLDDFMHPALEPELAVRIGSNWGAASGPAIDAVAAAFEVIDDRLADYSKLDARALVADNCWNQGFVIGSVQLVNGWPQCGEVSLVVDGAELRRCETPAGDDPRELTVWLEQNLRGRGYGLVPGDWVLTGSFLEPYRPAAGQLVSFAVEGIGSVSLRIS